MMSGNNRSDRSNRSTTKIVLKKLAIFRTIHGLTERSNRSEIEQSFGKNEQNCAQNMAPNDPNDSNDTFRSSQEGNPSYAGAEVGAEIRQELTRMQNRDR